MRELEKRNKELLEEVEKLKRQVKTLKFRKKYGLVWEDEKEPEQIVLDCQVKIPILKEVKNKEIVTDKDKPQNILIEGDNYHSLSVLNYTHKKKIDVIYIDPPYNTGNKHEWKYNDRWIDENDEYKHSKWINFMNIRLNLAKTLLSNRGVIFISIDEHEVAQLKLLCDSIFQEVNFCGIFVWQKKYGGGNDSGQIATEHEYILCYSNSPLNSEWLEPHDEKYLKRYKEEDKIGKFFWDTLERPGLKNPIEVKLKFEGKEYVLKTFRSQKTVDEDLKSGEIRIVKLKNNKISFQFKQRLKEGKKPRSLLQDKNGTSEEEGLLKIGSNASAKQELRDIFHKDIFNNPKPTTLVKYLIKLVGIKEGVVLDFFAGSGTTGHATAKLNSEESTNFKYILCTNNEDNNSDGLKIATDICYPRIEKVIKGYKNLKDEQIEGLGGNLRYFKSELWDIDHISHVSDEQKIKLTYQAGDMIALREGTFEEVEKDEWWQIFKDGTKYTAIYFKEDKKKLNELVKKLSKLKEKVILYIFSWGKNEYKNEFTEYKNIKVEDIPEPIIDVYKEVNRLN